MSDDDLLFTTAARAASLIRQRKLSPLELMQAVLARAEAIQPTLNPFAALLHERALEAADMATRTPRPDLPLHGVPISIKDQVDVGGVPTTVRPSMPAPSRPRTTSPLRGCERRARSCSPRRIFRSSAIRD